MNWDGEAKFRTNLILTDYVEPNEGRSWSKGGFMTFHCSRVQQEQMENHTQAAFFILLSRPRIVSDQYSRGIQVKGKWYATKVALSEIYCTSWWQNMASLAWSSIRSVIHRMRDTGRVWVWILLMQRCSTFTHHAKRNLCFCHTVTHADKWLKEGGASHSISCFVTSCHHLSHLTHLSCLSSSTIFSIPSRCWESFVFRCDEAEAWIFVLLSDVNLQMWWGRGMSSLCCFQCESSDVMGSGELDNTYLGIPSFPRLATLKMCGAYIHLPSLRFSTISTLDHLFPLPSAIYTLPSLPSWLSLLILSCSHLFSATLTIFDYLQ